MNSYWEIIDEMCLKVYAKNKPSCHLTGSWHSIGTRIDTTLWNALKFQAPAMNGCWKKCDRNFCYGQTDRQTHKGKTVSPFSLERGYKN